MQMQQKTVLFLLHGLPAQLTAGGIDVSAQGEVQDCVVVRSSGNVQYDSSCVNAIMRTSRAGDFPPPPSPEYQSLEMVFTLNELRRG